MLVAWRLWRGAEVTHPQCCLGLRSSSKSRGDKRNACALSAPSRERPEAMDIGQTRERALTESCENCLRIAQMIAKSLGGLRPCYECFLRPGRGPDANPRFGNLR